jgi:internalin A
LVVNTELGFNGTNLDFLESVGDNLAGLEVSGSFADDSGVAACRNLIELNLNTDCTNRLEWNSFTALEDVFCYSSRIDDTFGKVDSLRRVSVYGADSSVLDTLAQLNLLELTLRSARIQEAPSLSKWPALKSLDVGYAPKMVDFSGLERVDNSLNRLTLNACSKLGTLDFVRRHAELEYLDFSDCRKVASLQSLQSLSQLKELYFYGNTEILDGDLSPLAGLPQLKRAVYVPRKRYRGAPEGFPTLED